MLRVSLEPNLRLESRHSSLAALPETRIDFSRMAKGARFAAHRRADDPRIGMAS